MNQISDDYRNSCANRPKTIGWDFLFYALMGLVITFAVRIAGVVVVFAFLIIPATVSTIFSSHNGIKLVITWAVGIVSSLGGLLFAYRLDFSVGPAIAMLLGVVLLVAALGRTCFAENYHQ